jgi:hypothetical protein
MDGLALLCNLFADGPVTLKRLRLAGVENLGALERAAPARLAEWLHASLPQAQAFAEEARKLVRRLSEENPLLASRPEPAAAVRTAVPAPTPVAPAPAPAHGGPAGSQLLTPGLFPGLDEALCARLALHQVRTVQALGEFAGLALARRTGIPYSTLLELSRQSRRFSAERARGARVAEAPAWSAPAAPEPRPELRPELRVVALRGVELRSFELQPFEPRSSAAHAPEPHPPLSARPQFAPPEAEPTRSDEFTLPALEPESAGPFG